MSFSRAYSKAASAENATAIPAVRMVLHLGLMWMRRTKP